MIIGDNSHMFLIGHIPQVSVRQGARYDPAFPDQTHVALDADSPIRVEHAGFQGVRLVFRRLRADGTVIDARYPIISEIVVIVWPEPQGEMADSKSYNTITICDPGFAARGLMWDAPSAESLWAELRARGLTDRV